MIATKSWLSCAVVALALCGGCSTARTAEKVCTPLPPAELMVIPEADFRLRLDRLLGTSGQGSTPSSTTPTGLP